MTLTCTGPEDGLHQIILQLNKLVDVIHARDHTDDQAVTRELALFKVACSISERTEVLQITEVFRGKTIDISDDTITVEATGTSEKMDALEALLTKFDLREMVRTAPVMIWGDCEVQSSFVDALVQPSVEGGKQPTVNARLKGKTQYSFRTVRGQCPLPKDGIDPGTVFIAVRDTIAKTLLMLNI